MNEPTECPNCGRMTCTSQYGGERGEAGPFRVCSECDFDEEAITRTAQLPSHLQGTLWRHHKGDLYKIIGFGIMEETGKGAFIYQDATNQLSVYWIRSVENWFAVLPMHGPRFRRESPP